MKPTFAANLSLVLVVFGWAVFSYAVFSTMGDPGPRVPDAEIFAMRRHALILGFFGSLCLLASLWFSGYSFSTTKIRSAVALLLLFVPFTLVFWYGLQ